MRSLRIDSSFWRYVVNGSIITIAYFSLSFVLSLFIESKLLVSQIAYVPIFLFAFFTHKYFSFRSKNKILYEFAKFFAVQISSFLVLSFVVIEIFALLQIPGNSVFLAIIVARACLNYFCFRFFVFRDSRPGPI